MADLSDLSLRDRLWFHRYRFRSVEPLTLAPLARPLGESRLAIVTSTALHQPHDPPFEKQRGGDLSYRTIPADVDLGSLVCTHPSRSWDRSGVEEDPNLAFPLDRLRELESRGVIGGVGSRHFSIQGSITAPGRLVARTAPEIADALIRDRVDAVLLTPV